MPNDGHYTKYLECLKNITILYNYKRKLYKNRFVITKKGKEIQINSNLEVS